MSSGTAFGTGTEWFANWSTAYDYQVADVNGDGRADMAGRNLTTGQVLVGLSNGAAFGATTTWLDVWNLAYDYKLADLNGDGAWDIVGRSSVLLKAALSTN